jgi:hypothetical protein
MPQDLSGIMNWSSISVIIIIIIIIINVILWLKAMVVFWIVTELDRAATGLYLL